MAGLSRDQQQLSKALLDLGDEAMLLEELDGLIAGVLVCPETVPPSLWLKRVWHRASDEGQPAFENLDHANAVIGLVMSHYNTVARILFEQPESYEPLLAVDQRTGEVLWEIWVAGFDTAVGLHPGAWAPIVTSSNREAAKAFSGLMLLADAARRDPRFTEEEIGAITATAHEKLAGWVIALNNWRLTNKRARAAAPLSRPAMVPAPHVGRNEMCPCGSGKKYKRCCGLN